MTDREAIVKLERQLKAAHAAFDALKQERDLWRCRAEAMADSRTDAAFNEDQIFWRKKAIAAIQANGWFSPEAVAALREDDNPF